MRKVTDLEKIQKHLYAKWMPELIQKLRLGIWRFGNLETTLTQISPRTLSIRLARLEKYGLVTRKVYPEVPPRVEYKLTDTGHLVAEEMEVFKDIVNKIQ